MKFAFFPALAVLLAACTTNLPGLAPPTVAEVEAERQGRLTRVDEIVAVRYQTTDDGVVLYAMGRTPRQGYFDPQLRLIERRGNTLVFEMLAQPPVEATSTGTARSRQIIAALHLRRSELVGVTAGTVVSKTNQMTVRGR
ncbi:hypothetical protein [Oceanomicrobium pacificus]|uniref:Lipoprotein n=1 Tax=Oceanomicrobium pacificus TaxID=2692916 RepID=A0A6B0TW03_9RHOB|nr:hypothetical protein [Oceanomicrobium pacificus]MXU65738.1 hypothetical protein [Oceanomicrobium pacificus]